MNYVQYMEKRGFEEIIDREPGKVVTKKGVEYDPDQHEIVSLLYNEGQQEILTWFVKVK